MIVMVIPYGRISRPDILAEVPFTAWKKNGRMYVWLVIDICRKNVKRQLTMLVRFLMMWWGISALSVSVDVINVDRGLWPVAPIALENLHQYEEREQKAEAEKTAPYSRV